MKTFRIPLLSALLFATFATFAAQNDVVVTFSTPGTDKYADGTTVLDGECYALVWTPTGKTFAGIKADGTEVDAETGKIVLCVPAAKDGKCPGISFEINADIAAANFQNGSWGVYLLDTRIYADGKASLAGVDNGRANVVNAAGSVSTASCGLSAGEPSSVIAEEGATASEKTLIPGGDKAKITGIKIVDGNVCLTVSDASPFAAYQAAEVKLDDSAPADASGSKPVQGDATSDIVVVTPAKGSSGFFKVIRK